MMHCGRALHLIPKFAYQDCILGDWERYCKLVAVALLCRNARLQ